jgi:hypothetical protein
MVGNGSMSTGSEITVPLAERSPRYSPGVALGASSKAEARGMTAASPLRRVR